MDPVRPRQPGVDRIVALSDGVFAIALTLLVLGLDVPDLPADGSGEALTDALWSMAGRVEMYVVSFLVIGFYWYMHLHLFRFVRRHDNRLIWLNLLFLLPVTVLPFMTELVGDYPEQRVPVVLYFGTMTLTALIQTLMWRHAAGAHRLIGEDTSAEEIAFMTRKVLVPAAVFILGTLLAFVDLRLARRVYLLILLEPFVTPHFAPGERAS